MQKVSIYRGLNGMIMPSTKKDVPKMHEEGNPIERVNGF
jgi:hypothetical protein